MQKKQFISIGVAILFIIALYFLGDFRGSKATKTADTSSESAHQHQDEATQNMETFDILAHYTSQATKLTGDDKKKIDALYDAFQKNKTPEICRDLAEYWEKKNEIDIAAYFYKNGAFLENTEKSLTFAGQLLLAIMSRTDNQPIRRWQAMEAIECFEKTLQLNPENIDAKVALATCYTEGTGETMKGVTLLREVTQKDSTNISANIILGKLAIQSGQFDKAQRRLEMVLGLRPDNTEAMYFLAEAYKGLGQKDKAIEMFEKCKTLVNNPDFAREIDNYIKSFK